MLFFFQMATRNASLNEKPYLISKRIFFGEKVWSDVGVIVALRREVAALINGPVTIHEVSFCRRPAQSNVILCVPLGRDAYITGTRWY